MICPSDCRLFLVMTLGAKRKHKARREVTQNGPIKTAIPVFQSVIVQRRPTNTLIYAAVMSTKT